MDSTANILQFCRLCLVKDGVNIPIFDEQGDIRQIYLKISSCLPVKVAREDHLPKKICDGCSNKLDICYDFWRTSAESEKQLLAWLGATGKDAAQVNVKEEDNFDEPLASDISKNDDDENKCYMFEQKVEEGPPVEINDEPPPSKRPRRTAAVKAAIAMDQNSDDDGDSGEPITKMEDDSDETDGDDREPAFVDVPSTSADDQPGPSGVSKDGSDAPILLLTAADEIQIVVPDFNTTEDQWRCGICDEVYASLANLKRHHTKRHTVEREHECPLCDEAFRTQRQLAVHKERVHHTDYRYYCDPCKRYFDCQSSLDKHTSIEHEGFRYECEFCDRSFKDVRLYKQHVATHSKDYIAPGYRCDVCDKIIYTKSGMRKHKLAHTGGNKTVCDVCGKSFLKMTDHQKLHTGEKPFKCEDCGKLFRTSSNLTTHRRVHTKERPYGCEICGKTFTQRWTLVIHIRNHKGERPFKCEKCSKSFLTRSVMNKHLCIGKSQKN